MGVGVTQTNFFLFPLRVACKCRLTSGCRLCPPKNNVCELYVVCETSDSLKYVCVPRLLCELTLLPTTVLFTNCW